MPTNIAKNSEKYSEAFCRAVQDISSINQSNAGSLVEHHESLNEHGMSAHASSSSVKRIWKIMDLDIVKWINELEIGYGCIVWFGYC